MSSPRTSSGLGVIVPSCLNPVLIRAEQRSSTCSGVSASSRQTGQRAAGQRLSSHRSQALEGACRTLCRHWVELVQWPTLSWWMSTAVYFLQRQGGEGASPSAAGTIRPARLEGNVWSGSRLSRRRPVNRSDVHRCVRLVEGAGLLGNVIGSLVALEAAVGRHPLEVHLPTALRQPRWRPPDRDAQRGGLGRGSVPERREGRLGIRADDHRVFVESRGR